jgi:hypothetical protein
MYNKLTGEEAQTGVVTAVKRRRAAHGEDEAVAPDLEETRIVRQGTGGDTAMRRWWQGEVQ